MPPLAMKKGYLSDKRQVSFVIFSFTTVFQICELSYKRKADWAVCFQEERYEGIFQTAVPCIGPLKTYAVRLRHNTMIGWNKPAMG